MSLLPNALLAANHAFANFLNISPPLLHEALNSVPLPRKNVRQERTIFSRFSSEPVEELSYASEVAILWFYRQFSLLLAGVQASLLELSHAQLTVVLTLLLTLYQYHTKERGKRCPCIVSPHEGDSIFSWGTQKTLFMKERGFRGHNAL